MPSLNGPSRRLMGAGGDDRSDAVAEARVSTRKALPARRRKAA